MPGMGSSRQDDSDGNELADFPGQRLPDEEARIDGRRESSHQAGVQLRDHSDADVSSNRIGPEEIARLWDDLEAETGFRSYFDYLKAYEKRYPHLRKLKQQLRFMSTTAPDQSLKDEGSSDGPRHCCAIYNVYDGDDAFPKMNLQCGTSSANVILPALRQPTATATLRIVLWEALDSVPEVLHSLGLGLKIQPRFFQALLARNTDDETLDTFEEPPLTSELLVIDRYVVAIARQYYPASPDIKSVILIARVDSGHWDPKKDFNETIPFQKQATKENSGPVNRLPVWMLEYVRLLKSELEKWTESAVIAGDLSFRSLIPLLQLNASRIHKQSRLILKEFRRFEKKKGHSLEDLFRMRSSLRRLIEDSEENSEEFRNIVRGRMANDTQHSNPFEMVENELRQACLEARRWEAEIRDYLQLQTGELALKESRKSIELSNLQIEEAKRGQLQHSFESRRYTILINIVRICKPHNPSACQKNIDTVNVSSHNPRFHIRSSQPGDFYLRNEHSAAQWKWPTPFDLHSHRCSRTSSHWRLMVRNRTSQ